MATLAESFLADLEDLSDDEPERETSESQDEEDDGVSSAAAIGMATTWEGIQLRRGLAVNHQPWGDGFALTRLPSSWVGADGRH